MRHLIPQYRRLLGSAALWLVAGPVLVVCWCAGLFGQNPSDLRRQRAAYDLIRRVEEAGPGREVLWTKQELKKGKLVKKIVANPPAIWLGDAFGELSPMQRSALLDFIHKEKLQGKTKKPVAVSLYDVTSDGKQGKRVGSYLPTTGVKLTGKRFSEAPEDADSEAEIFPLDATPPAK